MDEWLDTAPLDDEPLTAEVADALVELWRALPGQWHTLDEWDDLEADGVICLGYRNGSDGEHEHWPSTEERA